MGVTPEVITASVIVGPLAVAFWKLLSKRLDRMEGKIDGMVTDRALFITRDEYSNGMIRVHSRMDEHLAEEQEIVSRVSRLEGRL